MKNVLFFLVSLLIALPIPAVAADVTVEMLNKSANSKERNVFMPALVQVNPGDTVTWVSKDRGHNVEFIRGAVPDGVKPFRSALSKDTTYKFTEPGVYVYKCTPHYGMGMVGVVVVGDSVNLLEVQGKKYPGKAKKRVAEILDKLS
ncbi:MAG: pseudoazurin [Rhodospirillaceae bacterium]|nr:pseudoazurin [Rhodospirillaceae bacterium]